ncbi:hypothetical protein NKR23_g5674 [Pleurostoma richardsiae]|uniref:Luciferase domain-containing protein n=1 Tax=Pleurostoma richardsiae TaxID=41990 RepID=A0AA38RD44_9PEZI|nr:hypothetical protein NKR23_g5674 [Pleurostoma richardsiae]
MAVEVLTRAVTVAKSHPFYTGLVAAVLSSVIWTLSDYWEWRSFGTGGTTPSIAGYLRMTRLRIGRLFGHDDVNDASHLKATGPCFLPADFPRRAGSRPQIVSRTLPHREVPGQEELSQASLARLHSLARRLATAHPDVLDVGPSKTEGGTGDALYAHRDLPTLNPAALNDVVDREIAHVHPAENSLHVFLSEPDARRLVEGGWGQRFPAKFAPPGWIMVYAPRNMGEVELVEAIVKAAVEWVTELKV